MPPSQYVLSANPKVQALAEQYASLLFRNGCTHSVVSTNGQTGNQIHLVDPKDKGCRMIVSKEGNSFYITITSKGKPHSFSAKLPAKTSFRADGTLRLQEHRTHGSAINPKEGYPQRLHYDLDGVYSGARYIAKGGHPSPYIATEEEISMHLAKARCDAVAFLCNSSSQVVVALSGPAASNSSVCSQNPVHRIK